MIFETERLYLRRIIESDLESFYDIMANNDTMQYLGKTLSKKEVDYYISEVSKQQFNDNEGEYAIVLKATNEVIGQFSITTKKEIKDQKYLTCLIANIGKKAMDMNVLII